MLEEFPKRLAALEAALSESNFETGHREAHTIKGSAANIGAPRVREAALAVEQACRKSPGLDDRKLARLRDEIEDLMRLLKERV